MRYEVSDEAVGNVTMDGRYRLRYVGKDAYGTELYEPDVKVAAACSAMAKLGFGIEHIYTGDAHRSLDFTLSDEYLPARWAQAPDLCMASTFPAAMKRAGFDAQASRTLTGWRVVVKPDLPTFESVACGMFGKR